MTYEEFLQSKETTYSDAGFEVSDDELNPNLFDFQKIIVRSALRRGKSCIFADCGMGKTIMLLNWAHVVHQRTGGMVLVVSPLAVATQTVLEGDRFGLPVRYCRDGVLTPEDRVVITNYEMLHHFDTSRFVGLVLDESSILKSYSGKIRNEIIAWARHIPYRLACTATPAPNDYMELGNHAEFCGVKTRSEMLSEFFVHDGGDTSKWRLKGHARAEFWRWVSKWSVVIRKPSDLGCSDEGFQLPEMHVETRYIQTPPVPGWLFSKVAETLSERRDSRKATLEERCRAVAAIANSTKDQVLVWCDFNAESEMLTKMIKDAVEVKGSDTMEHKETAMTGFAAGTVRVLVTKPSIAGFGMNWQNCHRMVFCGLSDSYEQFYQAIRRCWRFGQKCPVEITLVISDTDENVVENIQRKERDFRAMQDGISVSSRETIGDVVDHREFVKPSATVRIPEFLMSF